MRKGSNGVNAFTLVELLVVIGIIAVLVAILLPSLTKARENANRVKCAANLHNLGNACINFAVQNRGYFPRCWRSNGPPNIVFPIHFNSDADSYPFFLNGGPVSESKSGLWMECGTGFETLIKNGLTVKSLECPSRVAWHGKALLGIEEDFGGFWGRIWAYNHYIYIGGMQANKLGMYNANWGTKVPANKLTDRRPSELVLAADEVSDFTAWGWPAPFMINHRSRKDYKRPEFANILHADGHVEAVGSSYFPKTLTRATNACLVPSGGDQPTWWW